jgi:membrane protein required for colicin V production
MPVPPLIGATTSLQPLDLVIVVIIASSVLLGLVRGLIQSVAGLLGLILGAVFAGRLAALISPALDQAHIQHPQIPAAATFIVAFLAIVTGVEFVAGLLRMITRLLFLGWVDRLGGAVFGALRGVLLSMILVAGLTLFGSKSLNTQIRQAQTAVFLWQNLSSLTAMLPAGMQQSTLRLVTHQVPFLGQTGTQP